MSGSSLSLQSPPSPLSSPSSALHPDAHLNARSVSPGAVSVESFRPSPGALTPPSGSRSPIFVPGTESAFFKSLLDFFYTASTPMGEVFTFLFEDSSYIDKEDALDKLSQASSENIHLYMARSLTSSTYFLRTSSSCGEASCSQTCIYSYPRQSS